MPPLARVMPAGKPLNYITIDGGYTSYHLSLALDKPLHKMNEAEQLDLAAELQSIDWQHREEFIAKCTEDFMALWRENSPGAFQKNIRVHTAQFAFTPTSVRMNPTGAAHYTLIQVAVPDTLPPHFVKAFAERQIREQVEEV